MLGVTCAVLYAMGRPLWCSGGELWLWSGAVWSRHNSQHLFDPYTLTHVSHGIVLLWVARTALGDRARGPAGVVLAILLEAAWEVFENTDFVIRRYRETTISLDYFGDSVANSLGDVLAMLAGYLGAMRLPVRRTLVALVVLEALLVVWIRDGLVLNVVMLLWPLDAVRAWQTAGAWGPP